MQAVEARLLRLAQVEVGPGARLVHHQAQAAAQGRRDAKRLDEGTALLAGSAIITSATGGNVLTDPQLWTFVAYGAQ